MSVCIPCTWLVALEACRGRELQVMVSCCVDAGDHAWLQPEACTFKSSAFGRWIAMILQGNIRKGDEAEVRLDGSYHWRVRREVAE